MKSSDSTGSAEAQSDSLPGRCVRLTGPLRETAWLAAREASRARAARMMRAMELLAEPRASVSATAYAVGFASLGAFTTAFTERCGETPSAYRARIGPPRARRPRRA